jgi:hypothetical protein
VTVEIAAAKFGNYGGFGIDGSLFNPVSNMPLSTQSNDRSGLTHFTIVSSYFPTTTPDEAFYQVYVSGNKGGGVKRPRRRTETLASDCAKCV